MRAYRRRPAAFVPARDHKVAGHDELHRVVRVHRQELADGVRFVGARTRCVAREDDCCVLGSVGAMATIGAIGSVWACEDGPDSRHACAGNTGTAHEDPRSHAGERHRVQRVDGVACFLRDQAESETLALSQDPEDAGVHYRRPFGPEENPRPGPSENEKKRKKGAKLVRA